VCPALVVWYFHEHVFLIIHGGLLSVQYKVYFILQDMGKYHNFNRIFPLCFSPQHVHLNKKVNTVSTIREKTIENILEHRAKFQEHRTKFQEHRAKFQEHRAKFQEHRAKFQEHRTKFHEHRAKFQEHRTKFQEHRQSFKNTEQSFTNTELSFKSTEQSFKNTEQSVKNTEQSFKNTEASINHNSLSHFKKIQVIFKNIYHNIKKIPKN
jgi:uncharacterized coiled-coil DUF342 family protein